MKYKDIKDIISGGVTVYVSVILLSGQEHQYFFGKYDEAQDADYFDDFELTGVESFDDDHVSVILRKLEE